MNAPKNAKMIEILKNNQNKMTPLDNKANSASLAEILHAPLQLVHIEHSVNIFAYKFWIAFLHAIHEGQKKDSAQIDVTDDDAASLQSNLIEGVEEIKTEQLLAFRDKGFDRNNIGYRYLPRKTIDRLFKYRYSDDDLKKALDELRRTTVLIDLLVSQGKKKVTQGIGMIREWEVGPSVVGITLPPQIEQAILQLNKSDNVFMLLNWGEFHSIQGKYAAIIYKLCSSYLEVGATPYIEKDLFRTYMGLKPTEYVETKNLTALVIRRAINDINAKNHIPFTISYEWQKNGRTATHVRFVTEVKASRTNPSPSGLDAIEADVIETPTGTSNPDKVRSIILEEAFSRSANANEVIADLQKSELKIIENVAVNSKTDVFEKAACTLSQKFKAQALTNYANKVHLIPFIFDEVNKWLLSKKETDRNYMASYTTLFIKDPKGEWAKNTTAKALEMYETQFYQQASANELPTEVAPQTDEELECEKLLGQFTAMKVAQELDSLPANEFLNLLLTFMGEEGLISEEKIGHKKAANNSSTNLRQPITQAGADHYYQQYFPPSKGATMDSKRMKFKLAFLRKALVPNIDQEEFQRWLEQRTN